MQTGNPLSADKLTNIFRTSPKDPLRIINREGSTIEFKESYSHAGMAQTFLKEPTTLTDDDVMELLTFIFHSEAVQKKLDLLIENRKELEQPNGS